MNGEPIIVLFTSAGRRVELIQCFRRAAAALGKTLFAISVDAEPELSAACRIADQVFRVPRVTDESYPSVVIDICKASRCRLLIPTIDPELKIMALLRPKLALIGTHVVISDLDTVDIADDKAKTAAIFAAAGVQTPRTATPGEVLENPSDWRWPAFAKPRGGSSSINVSLVESRDSLVPYLANPDLIIQERLEGVEYTVNMFMDRGGRLRCAVPHRRIEVRGGEVSKGRTERIPILEEYAKRIAKALPGALGPLCFQAFVNRKGAATVFEINARFGGGYPLADHAGATFALWLLEEVLDIPSTAHNNWRTGVTMLRYDAAVFDG